MMPPDLFDLEPAIEGMTEAAAHADPKDIAAARDIMKRLAGEGSTTGALVSFTAEDVTVRLSDAQRDRLTAFPNALGGMFHQAQREGIIRKLGAVQARRPEARGRWITLWAGVVPSDR